jgi:tetratricopeptide (TPR) repeat protein
MSGLTYLDLDLMFTRDETGYRVQVLRSPAGDGQVAVFDAPFTELELENLALKMGRFRARARRVESAPVAAAKDVGSRLYSAVFADAVHECLRRSLDHAREENAQLRIRLRLSDCPELANLPWEMLYDQGDDWFIALSNMTPVVRYVQLPDPPRALHVTLPLKILVIRSEPADYPELDLDAEWGHVAEALSELTDAGAIAFTELASPTMGDLRRALVRDSFHVLHYMGHGGFDEQNGGVLLFADRTGHSVPVTAGDLGVLLRDHISMRLAVLNACEGARTDPADPFAGVADTLVRRGIPAVVAMQFEFSDDAAIEFAPALYGALAAGLPVDAAVGEARKAVYTVSPLEWATPVLYLRAADGQLFDITPDTPPPSPHAKPQGAGSNTQKDSTTRHEGPTAEQSLAQADFLCERQRYAEAEAAYRAAIALDPGLAPAYAGLGVALHGLGQHAEADFAYQAATRLDPGLIPANDSPPADPKPQEITRTAVVSIRRRSELNSAAAAWIVLIDGKSVGQIRAKQAQEYPVAPGTHRIQVKMSPRWGDYSSPVEVITLNAGERAAFICRVTRPVSVKESLGAAFSPSRWKEQLAAAKDDYITLDHE